jgi:hypothetical protein
MNSHSPDSLPTSHNPYIMRDTILDFIGLALAFILATLVVILLPF